jgi:hypothetical protein
MNQNDLKIGDYTGWNLILEETQSISGRCYVIPKRPSVNSMSDVFNGDLGSLFHELIPQWENAVKECFYRQGYEGHDILISGSGTYKFQIDLVPQYKNKTNDVQKRLLPHELKEVKSRLEEHLK